MSQFNTNTVNKNITAASLIAAAEQEAASVFDRIRKISEFNTFKVIDAFRKCEVSERHFAPTTGYGYSDQGREMLARLFSEIFRTEDAIVSPHFASGTHTLSVGLFGLLRPGDRFLSVTGTPYDTIRGVIGIEGNADGSMKDFGIGYSEVALTSEGKMDIPAVMDALAADDTIKVVYIQRSRGYELRPSITIAEMENSLLPSGKNIRRSALRSIIATANLPRKKNPRKSVQTSSWARLSKTPVQALRLRAVILPARKTMSKKSQAALQLRVSAWRSALTTAAICLSSRVFIWHRISFRRL